ncbi:glycosyl hydrolase [Nocardioides sp. YIM 152588]|uniref:glycosyl hydrolase n=1 Tax=Nocardioides sp. YIM 152588 TaxID=3158259 RepID=UPI0032E3A69E
MTASGAPFVQQGRHSSPSHHGAGQAAVPRELTRAFAPTIDSRPMARMWFPDAGAGRSERELDLVRQQINEMAEGGFGGVEISFLADTVSYDNEDAAEIGWGSENWSRVVKTLLRTANAVRGGFKVDFTITSHWPPIVNNIDPNDPEQQQETSYAYRKLDGDDLAAGAAAVPRPDQKLRDGKGAPFIFTDTLDAATLLEVTSVGDDGTPVFDLAGARDVTGATTPVEADPGAGEQRTIDSVAYAGSPAGVPDRAWAAENGLDYDADVVGAFGPEPASDEFAGKIDGDGNRRRMADWQLEHATDLSGIDLSGYVPSAGETLAPGDLVLFGSFHRGTGQVSSGGAAVTIHNRSYVTNYFRASGAERIFQFWDDHILDRETKRLLRRNARLGSSIFEDSIEVSHQNPLWTPDLLDTVADRRGVDTAGWGPVLATGDAELFDDPELATRMVEDYNMTLGSLYEDQHASLISEWARSFGYTYRAQAYTLSGLDIATAAAAVDVPEGDNSTSGDGLRNLSAALNLTGGHLLSMETTTFYADQNTPWHHNIREVNGDFSHGVNRSIFHGSAFAKTFNMHESDWPGWNFMKEISPGFSAYNGRQIWWDDVDTFSDYVGRSQAIMQTGTADVDVAFLLGSNDGYRHHSGNEFQDLLDHGYSYNLVSEGLLEATDPTVSDGVLGADGPSYQALVVKEAERMSVETAERLVRYARAGLPVLLFDSDISRTYGTDPGGDRDDRLQELLATLVSLPGVTEVADQDALRAQLESGGVVPASQYDVPRLETSHRETSSGTDYYYFYNAAAYLTAPAAAGDTTIQMTEAASLEPGDELVIGSTLREEHATVAAVDGDTVTLDEPLVRSHAGPADPLGPWGVKPGAPVSAVTDQEIRLEGNGVPYLHDAWTGDITPVAEYRRTADGVVIDAQVLDLEDRDAAIVALSDARPAGGFHATAVSGGSVAPLDRRTIVHRAFEPGSYRVATTAGTRRFSVSAVPSDVALPTGWTLDLESWGPDPERNDYDPTASAVVDVSFDDVDLATWEDLPATADQLAALGVESMGEVSGIGRYTTSFVLGQDWRRSGAVLQMRHADDMLTEVVVNGTVVDDVDQLSDAIDLGGLLRPGRNTLTIQIDTSLSRRIGDYDNPAKFWSLGASGEQHYGLLDVVLDAYRSTEIRADR